MSLEVGKIVEGKVTGVTGFGAFVDIGEGKRGLVHISEVAREYVENIADYVKEGDSVKVMIVSMENSGKISLSIKKALEAESREEKKAASSRPAVFDWSQKSEENLSFEDKMLKFKQASDEKMHDIKRNVESKRGGYRRGSGSY